MTTEQGSSGITRRWAVTDTYINAVAAAGGIPIVLAPTEGHIARLLSLVDGLVFSGGADLDPALYGNTNVHETTYGINPVRDRFELALIRAAATRDVPTLCICRGVQVMNVAFGGTLYQDVADQYSDQLCHSQGVLGVAAKHPSHRVSINPASLIASIYRANELETNSFHHQTLKNVPASLEVAGRSIDGSIEAVSMKDRRFFVGLQWHPEMMFAAHEEHLRPFTSLIEACSQ